MSTNCMHCMKNRRTGELEAIFFATTAEMPRATTWRNFE